MGGKENSIKVLVTGGGGFLGMAIVKRLLENGYSVSSFSRSEYPEFQALGVQAFRGDLADRDSVSSAVENQDIVIHSGALAGFWGPAKNFYHSNVLGTQNIVDACLEFKVKKLLYISSASVVFSGKDIENGGPDIPYPKKHQNHYSRTKRLGEKLVLEANNEALKTISLRPHIILGPGDKHILPRLIDRAKSGKLRIIGNGRNFIDIVYIDNLVDACMCTLEAMDNSSECLGKSYFITNGQPVLLWDFINELLSGINQTRITKKIPAPVALVIAKTLTGITRILIPAKEPVLTPYLVKELSQNHWFNIEYSKRDLGYDPKVSNKETLEKLIQGL